MKSDCEIIKEEHHWTSDEKIKWLGYGEWVEEVDFLVLEYLGFKACIRRVMVREPCTELEVYFGGHLCGYVQIPKDHIYFGDNDICVDCHFGLTFNYANEEHWIGFDCGHSGDIIPTIELFKKQREAAGEPDPFPIPKKFHDIALFHPVYRNISYCVEECVGIIDQLIEINAKCQNE